MKTQWVAALVAAVVTGLGCVVLYPVFCEHMLFPMVGVLGQIGTVLVGIGGAICGGLGATVGPKRLHSVARDRPTMVVVTLLMIFILTDMLGHLIWHTEQWLSQTHGVYFIVGSFLIGMATRFLHDRLFGRD